MTKSAREEEFPTPVNPVFKYLSCHPDSSPSWKDRLEQLLVGKAYYPSPRDFNDPFDCLPAVVTPATDNELRSSLPILIHRIRNVMPDRSESEIRVAIDEVLMRKSISEIDAFMQEAANTTASRMGVFCVAECIDSVLMWSHYASNHTGIAVGFELMAQQRGGLMPMFRVSYSNERPQLKYFIDPSPNEIMRSLTTKAAFWAYEQEWRSILPSAARSVVEFDPSVITGVVFGARCETDTRRWITDRVKDTSVRLFEAVADRRTFQLRIRPA